MDTDVARAERIVPITRLRIAEPPFTSPVPDWRWWLTYRYVDKPQYQMPEETVEIIRRDPTISEFILPYLIHSQNGRRHEVDGEEWYLAIKTALEISVNGMLGEDHTAAMLEAGILAGRPIGAVAPDHCEIEPMVQTLYERAFFDVRDWLSEREQIVRVVFAENLPQTRAAWRDFDGKVIAYGLGFDAFMAWKNETPSAEVRALVEILDDTFRYLFGLRELGVARWSDITNALHRLFEFADHLRATLGDSTAGAVQARIPDLSRRMVADLLAMVPEERVTMAKK